MENKDWIGNKKSTLKDYYIKERNKALEEVKLWENKIQNSKDIPMLTESRKSWLRSKTIALTRYECYREFIAKLGE